MMSTVQIFLLGALVLLAHFPHVGSVGTSETVTTTSTVEVSASGSTTINSKVDTSANASSSVSNSSNCLDDRDECPSFAARGDCEKNPRYMLAHCKLSCNACPDNIQYHTNNWGEPQESSGPNAAKIDALIRQTKEYMETKVKKQAMYMTVRHECMNRDKLCSMWAVDGECQNNPQFMTIQCAPACQTCEKIDHRIRCPVNDRAPKAWKPGSVDEMFERITTDPYYAQYEPKILSRPPEENTGVVPAIHTSKLPKFDQPWLVQLDNFLTDDECNRLIRLGADQGYEQSYDVGHRRFDGSNTPHMSDARTSNNAWCTGKCYEDEMAQQILAKIENVTGLPDANSEFLQLLRYEVGQKYDLHHDYVPQDFERSQGVRILTVFLYLSDVEEGGETHFPKLDVTVKPKKGAALIWPNVFMLNPDAADNRLVHAALPVVRGQKYAANAWFHQRNFKEVYYRNCN